ncbi:MAG: serine/threonine-protein kinase [Nannocystaceae bacterium]
MSTQPQRLDLEATVPVGADAPTGRPALVVAGDEPSTGELALDEDDDAGVPLPLPERKPWMPPDFSGRVLGGRYKILELIGFGGMATVYEAEHIKIKKRVAVKILNPDYADDQEIAHRFLQEAQTASQLRHEHIIDITDYGEADGTVFFVMELLEGEDLSTTLLETGPLHAPRVIAMAEQICDALAAAHAIGVIHRDIKPANCFRLTRAGNSDFIKVLDFGIAKVATNDRTTQRTTGSPLGTPGYMALELLKGEAYDHRVDIYALGVLMYKLLTNKMPFPAPNAYGTLAKQLDGEPTPLREAAPEREIPEILEDLILKALARDPEHRFQSALELLDALRGLAVQLPSGSRLPRDPRDWGVGGAEPTPVTNAQQLSIAAGVAPVDAVAPRRRITLVATILGAVLFGVLFALVFMRPPAGPWLGAAVTKARSAQAVDAESPRDTPLTRTPAQTVTPPPREVDPAPPVPAPPEVEAPTPDTPKARVDRLPRTLSESAVRRRIGRRKAALQKCRERYSGGLDAEHELQVSLVIEGSTGAVKEIKDLNGGSIAQMGACALKVVEGTVFPVAANDTKISHTIRF